LAEPEKIPYKVLDHMTDAEIEAFGSTLDEAFQNAALALENVMVDTDTIEPKTKIPMHLSAADMEELLYIWLEWLIVEQETEGLLFSKFECKISKGRDYDLEASSWGEKYDPKKHEEKTAVKAPTYHDMEIRKEIIEGKERFKLRFLLDL
jgi:SHS2 domain-containing protein